MPLDALPTIAREECFSQRLRVQVSCRVSSYSGYPYRKGILLEPHILTHSSASSSAQDRARLELQVLDSFTEKAHLAAEQNH